MTMNVTSLVRVRPRTVQHHWCLAQVCLHMAPVRLTLFLTLWPSDCFVFLLLPVLGHPRHVSHTLTCCGLDHDRQTNLLNHTQTVSLVLDETITAWHTGNVGFLRHVDTHTHMPGRSTPLPALDRYPAQDVSAGVRRRYLSAHVPTAHA